MVFSVYPVNYVMLAVFTRDIDYKVIFRPFRIIISTVRVSNNQMFLPDFKAVVIALLKFIPKIKVTNIKNRSIYTRRHSRCLLD